MRQIETSKEEVVPLFLAVHDEEMPRWHNMAVKEHPESVFSNTIGTVRVTPSKDYSVMEDG